MAESDPRSESEVFELLRRIMAREFRLEESTIGIDSTFEDLDLDSIDLVDVAVSVEDELGWRFDPDDMAGIRSVRDVVDRIRGVAHGSAPG